MTCKLFFVCCLTVSLSGCMEDDTYRGYMLSGRWFGDLGMMIGGQPAIGSDLEFVPGVYGDYTYGHGYERDYYYDYYGRVTYLEHYFTWTVQYGIVYMRFDNPELDCNIRDYSLSADYFEGYMDGVYSSTWFSLRNYDRYWTDYGYYSYEYYRGVRSGEDAGGIVPESDTIVCKRRVNMETVPTVQE